MKILAFAGSTSSTSINKQLVEFTCSLLPVGEVEVIDLNDYAVPTFSVDEEKREFPEGAIRFLEKIKGADAIICSMSEHNRNWTAAFKSLFDWSSRKELKVFQDKPMFVMSTSPGGYGGQNSLNIAKTVFPSFGGDIRETFALPKFYENFDVVNGVINAELKTELIDKVTKFTSEL
ncbi:MULTISPECIES: NADPH-dependent FMN reductase [Myroides]|uniref:NADPH-dependent FMN reductase n=1 Tax=Myroides albus TaxID=2562892 RepID=A0A6I3LIU3_9FLAO|nr:MULTISPECIES: NADPH-dependent FMN reductase [Myroides]MTG97734.1 NADPH-dependent FMN reductase [Myroides albus]MVX34904.1 NADPH-dependent FMN reductase [Myroides sp. LoEW2-1]UVD78717.1 NAD(P)H-dependent oxidoreductase [Myroides albus]